MVARPHLYVLQILNYITGYQDIYIASPTLDVIWYTPLYIHTHTNGLMLIYDWCIFGKLYYIADHVKKKTNSLILLS